MSSQTEKVVLVHGIWMSGMELFWLEHMLEDCGFECRRFHYPSLSLPPRDQAHGLQSYLVDLNANPVHFVGHSLGGILLLHLFDLYPDQPPGRLVLLGSPVRGSGVARSMAGSPWLRWLLGRSLEQGLLDEAPVWRGAHPLGVIAGNLALGMGRVLGGLEGISDGTVSIAETRIENATDSIELPVSHTSMVFSRAVARQICAFLRQARFEHD